MALLGGIDLERGLNYKTLVVGEGVSKIPMFDVKPWVIATLVESNYISQGRCGEDYKTESEWLYDCLGCRVDEIPSIIILAFANNVVQVYTALGTEPREVFNALLPYILTSGLSYGGSHMF